MESNFGKKYLIYLYLLLGALAAFPPLVTDMYLPALPVMTAKFNTVPSAVQMSLAACILGLAVGQLIFGPLSDKWGRKQLLKCALLLFILATVASIFSPTIEVLNICRFFQGLGGAGGVVLSRSVATDCYSGRELAKTLAIIGAINGIAPVTAPVIGGLFSESIGWKGIFCILLAIGIFLYLVSIPFRESHLQEKRYTGTLTSLFTQAGKLFRNSAYVRDVLIFGMSNGVLFGYISSASFILQNDLGLSELMFGILFGINSMAIGTGSMLSLKLRKISKVSDLGCAGMLLCSLLQLLNYYLGIGFWGYEILVFFMLFSVGMVFTSSTTLAMTEGKAMVGWASAIVGATGFLFGGIVTPLVGIGSIQISTYCIMTVCSLVSLIISCMAYRSKPVIV
ncbi:multidrug effflux MFS transporter [Muribaculum intestinale]|uniref:multidrug effflux MFS transporter n=1 Tax=Muribaculum intestinale TaxID=1796646 RepID=UPI0025AA0E1C|nr:multidrug effflux MFS transporter [Muribaculum intestinale]